MKRKTFFNSPHLNVINPKTSFASTDKHFLLNNLKNYDTDGGNTKNMNFDFDHDDEESSLVIDEVLDDFPEEELGEEASNAPVEDVNDDSNPPIIDSNKSIIEFSSENVCENNYQTILDTKSASNSESNQPTIEVSTHRVIEEDEYEEDDNGRSYDSPGLGYGKLWIFIRDLLQNERYNPRIIKWENEENGEFRITDSCAFSKLWAFVKGNKKMNYEIKPGNEVLL